MVTEMVSVSDIFWSERSSGSLVAPKTQSTRRTNSGPAQKTRARMFGLLVGKMSGLGWQWDALSWLHSCLHACMHVVCRRRLSDSKSVLRIKATKHRRTNTSVYDKLVLNLFPCYRNLVMTPYYTLTFFAFAGAASRLLPLKMRIAPKEQRRDRFPYFQGCLHNMTSLQTSQHLGFL